MSAMQTAMAENGKLHKGWLQLRKLAAQNLPCTCAYPRGLPVGGYFVLYQWSIKPIQRWRSVNVHLQTIRMLNSRSLHFVARNSSWGRDMRQLRRWSIYRLPPEE